MANCTWQIAHGRLAPTANKLCRPAYWHAANWPANARPVRSLCDAQVGGLTGPCDRLQQTFLTIAVSRAIARRSIPVDAAMPAAYQCHPPRDGIRARDGLF